MATIRLVPSTHAVSSTSYLTVSNANNMYTNVDSATYATITNTNKSTTARYLYLRGFNFGDIPNNAEVTGFTVKVKGYGTELVSSTLAAPCLANGTSIISNTTASTYFNTSITTITIPTGNLTWQQIVNYGSNFSIRVTVSRSNKNKTCYFYCYGAEIDVTYTVPEPKFFGKVNGTWTQFSKVYKKVNGIWVEQPSSTWATLFDTNINYRKMN